MKKIRRETDIPLVLMTYTNVLYTHGYTKFMSRVKKAGIDGLILPDMSIEESRDYLKSAKKNKLDTIFLVSPNTNNTRLKKIVKASTGFLYMVAVFGTTGVQTKIHKYTIDSIKNAKKIVGDKLPIGIGFGVSTPNDGVGPLTVRGVDDNGWAYFICGDDTIIQTDPSSNLSGFNCDNGEEPKQITFQRIYHRNADGSMTYYDRMAGTMTYHPTHGHNHSDDWGVLL